MNNCTRGRPLRYAPLVLLHSVAMTSPAMAVRFFGRHGLPQNDIRGGEFSQCDIRGRGSTFPTCHPEAVAKDLERAECFVCHIVFDRKGESPSASSVHNTVYTL